MRAEPAIPLFLWIATAMLLHIGGYKGTDEVVELVEDRQSVLKLTELVIDEVENGPSELDVALIDDDGPVEPPPEPPKAPDAPEDPDDPGPAPPDPAPPPAPPPDELPDELAAAEPPPEPEVLPPEVPPPPAVEEEKEPAVTPAPPVAQLEVPKLDGRIAVVQKVEDENQPDNPDAKYLADQANKVDQETQARNTSTDQMDPNPTPGGDHLGPTPEPGNSDENRVAQSEESEGEPDQPPPLAPAPEPTPPAAAATAGAAAAAPTPIARAAAAPPPTSTLPAQTGQTAQAAVEAQSAVHTLSAQDGSWAAPRGQEAREAVAAREAKPKRLPPLRTRFSQMLGYGSVATTESGVNLNLSPSAATAAVGQAQLEQERKQDGERRLSEHRGSWRSLGIERWRSAIENYVASVQPGNQTALNTARAPFATYLNQIHNRIHPIFADRFLGSLSALPASHPLNDMSMATFMEIVLHRDDGRIVRLGITKSSGVTAFDVGALEAVTSAAPFGTPPPSIVSPDGNIYLHWEFHREPANACSTYFARPYMIKARPTTAPPEVEPPKVRPPADERHGALGLDLPFLPAPPALNPTLSGSAGQALVSLVIPRASTAD